MIVLLIVERPVPDRPEQDQNSPMYYFYRFGNRKNNAEYENFWENPMLTERF